MARWFVPAALALALVVACGRAGYDLLDRDGDPGGQGADGGTGGDSDAGLLTTGEVAADTWLSEADRERNFGALGALRTARGPGGTILLRFELGPVPADRAPQSVTLAVTTTDGEQDAGVVRIYRVFEDWTEEEATWNLRAAGAAWSTPGCGVGSRDAAARADFTVDAAATRYQVALPAAVVEGWIDDPASNRGLALIATSGAGIELASSESDDPSRRPSLVVEWSP